MEINVDQKNCEDCGNLLTEYNKNAKCKKKHDWRKIKMDRNSEKYKNYQKKRRKSMQEAWRKRLDKLNKKTPPEYASRKISSKTLVKINSQKRLRNKSRELPTLL